VPLIVRWPGKIPAGTTTDAMISLMDLCKTVWAATDVTAPPSAAEDSVSQLSVLLDPKAKSVRNESRTIGASGGVIIVKNGRFEKHLTIS
jgi:arylsulfatase A-like enzyme